MRQTVRHGRAPPGQGHQHRLRRRAGSTGEAVYAGTKGAIIAFSKTLARETARHKITVNVVCPETPLLQSTREQSPKTEKVIEVDGLRLKDEARQKLLHDNARELFKI